MKNLWQKIPGCGNIAHMIIVFSGKITAYGVIAHMILILDIKSKILVLISVTSLYGLPVAMLSIIGKNSRGPLRRRHVIQWVLSSIR